MTSRYEPRTYRDQIADNDLIHQTVICNESDIQIYASGPIADQAHEAVTAARKIIGSYIESHKVFHSSLEPIVPLAHAPELIRQMCAGSLPAGVGPMATVASAVNTYVARMIPLQELILENGGDLYIRSSQPRKVLIHAGNSPLSERLAIQLPPVPKGVAVCTSSGTIGHSKSFGKADAALIKSANPFLADAVATALGNRIQTADDITEALAWAMSVRGVDGALVIIGDKIGMCGDVQLVKVTDNRYKQVDKGE